jgi:aryl-alcohol dehydrogenase-like predicted oxidoreductase
MERRSFLTRLAGLTAGIMVPLPNLNGKTGNQRDRLGEILPLRKLGKTGENVTMLGLGGYHIGWAIERDADETIEAALEGGIRFFDTAEAYGPHTSEIRYGKYLTPKYRDVVFLMTKTTAKDARTAREHLEASLKRMNTDYLDLWQVHAISSKEDADERLEKGVFDVLMDAKASGKARHIGFTGHSRAPAHAYLLEKLKGKGILETVQMPVNPVDAAHPVSFVKQVIPLALEQECGVLAMKALAGGQFFAEKRQLDNVMWETDDPVVTGRMSVADVFDFVWSLPVSVLITGASSPEMVREKIKLAGSFSKMNEDDRQKLIEKVVDISLEEKVEYYRNRG